MDSKAPGVQLDCTPYDGLLLEVDLSVYRLSAVKKAAYRFGDRFHVLIHHTNDGTVQVSLRSKVDLDDPDSAVGEFCNEMLDQELREQVAEETRPIRDLLLGQAFSATSLIDHEGDEADFREDPLGIGGQAPFPLADDLEGE